MISRYSLPWRRTLPAAGITPTMCGTRPARTLYRAMRGHGLDRFEARAAVLEALRFTESTRPGMFRPAGVSPR